MGGGGEVLLAPLGFYTEGRCYSVTGDFGNYVSILDADLQNLAVFALP